MNILGFSGLDTSVQFKRSWFPSLSEREYRIVQGLDSAAAFVRDGRVEFAAAEERFSRCKGTGAFPIGAMRAALAECGCTEADVDVVAHGFDYAPLQSQFLEDPYTRAQYREVYDPEVQLQLLKRQLAGIDWRGKFVAVPHHVAHAASAFFQSGMDESLVLVTDGAGERDSLTVFAASGAELEPIAKVSAFHSLGTLYGVFTLYLGFEFNSDEYKVMGLAPYGEPRRYFAEMMELVHLRDDGTYVIPVFGENKTLEERETHRGVLRALEARFGPPRAPEGEMEQRHKDIAAALQLVLQHAQMHVLRHFRRHTGLTNLCMAGGVALNCTANGVIKRSRLFRNVFVQPAAGDDGTALGAALYVQRRESPHTRPTRVGLPCWGPSFSTERASCAVEMRSDCRAVRYDSFPQLCEEAVRRLAAGQIIGWFQGAMEFGPRALGHRSILADPRVADMRTRVNMRVKLREGFRPFAPAVTAEGAPTYFDVAPADEATFAHMLFVMPVRPPYRAALPAVTHVDGSARLQTVSRELDERFWLLLREFERQTGVPILLNTSFNVRGQPIVCTPEEAIETFLRARLDALILDDLLITAAPPDAPPAEETRLNQS